MIQLGVLGAGNHSSQVHGEALKLLRDRGSEQFELAAVCDIDAAAAERYQRRFGVGRAYTQWERMLAEESLDALMAITPIAQTERIVADLLPAGIPLLIEKPPGETAAATQRLADAAIACGTPHMVSFNRRFTPALVRARDWIAADPDRNRPRLVLGRMLRKGRLESDFVMGTAIHQVDALLSLLGRPAEVAGRRLPAGKAGVSIVDYQIDFADGGRCIGVVAPDAGVLEETYEIIGEDYSILADALSGGVRIRHAGELVLDWAPPDGATGVERNGTVGETRAFLAAVAGSAAFGPTLTDSVLSMRAAEAIAAGGRTKI